MLSASLTDNAPHQIIQLHCGGFRTSGRVAIDAQGNGCLHDPQGNCYPEPVDVFTHGQCHALARALHDLTGWQIVLLCYTPFEGPSTEYDWDHAVVRAPDGDLIDIEGRGARERWLPRGLTVERDVDREVIEQIGYSIPDDHDAAARAFANAVLAKL